jgi:hypothetical protein
MAKVLHASASGYFPSCLEVNDELAIFTLEEAMEIYWKVKAWTITGTYINNLGESSPFSQTFTSTLADETKLVCRARNFFPYFENDFTPFTDEAFFRRPQFFYINSSGNLYGLEIDFQFLPAGQGFGIRAIGAGNINFDFGPIVGSLSVLGKSIPFYAEISDDGELPPSANGTMTPSEYWTYQ